MADQSATVRFMLVAPLCSSVLPMELVIDDRLVGTDTFRVAVSNPRTVSQTFLVLAGDHTLGARVVNGYVWPTHSVTLRPDTVYTDSLPFYCS